MAKFKVVLKGCLEYEYEIEAPDQDTAIALAKQQLYDQGITEITVVNVQEETTEQTTSSQ